MGILHPSPPGSARATYSLLALKACEVSSSESFLFSAKSQPKTPFALLPSSPPSSPIAFTFMAMTAMTRHADHGGGGAGAGQPCVPRCSGDGPGPRGEDAAKAEETAGPSSPSHGQRQASCRGELYASEHELGRGTFGKVTLVRRRSDGKAFVIKSLFMCKETMTPDEIFDAENELSMLSILGSHPNVTTLVESFQDSEGYHIVLELANGGTLNDRIVGWRDKTRARDEGEVLEIFCQLCLAIEHCHVHSILHRDIKPANIMLTNICREDEAAAPALETRGAIRGIEAVVGDGHADANAAYAAAAVAAAGAGAGANANAVDGDDSGAGLEAGGAPQSTTDGGGDTAAAVCGDSGSEIKEGNREGDAGKDTDRDASKEAEKEAEKDNRREASGTRAALHAPKFIRSRRGAAGAAVASTRISLGSKEGAELPLQRSSCDEVPKRGGGGGEKGVSASGPHRTVSGPPRTSRDSCGGGNVKDAAASKDEAGEEGKKEEKCASASETDTPSPLVPAAVSPSAEAAPDSPPAAVKFAPLFLVKLGDFGLSVQLKPGSKASTYGGTPHYISPEIVEGRPYEFPTDVWALGWGPATRHPPTPFIRATRTVRHPSLYATHAIRTNHWGRRANTHTTIACACAQAHTPRWVVLCCAHGDALRRHAMRCEAL